MILCIFLRYRSPMAEDNYTRITLRIPKDLLQQVNRAAFSTSKSQNAEIVARLQGSFDFVKLLPLGVQEAMATEAEESGTGPMEALEKLVLAGQSQGGQVLNLKIGPGTTTQQVRDALNVALELAPDADLVFEREPKA